MTNDLIAVIANVALALSFVVGLIFGIAQVRASERDRRERLTLETLRNFQTREFAELIQFISFRNMPLSYKEWQLLQSNDQILLIQLSQEMESLGIVVAEKLINIDLVDKTLGSMVITAWEKYKILFMDMREKMNDPFLGEYFQWLAEQIERRMRDNPRKPFFQSNSNFTIK